MKELSIEEKAKRYDEAIKVAADIKAGTATYITDGTPVVDAIFPELKESEDERIRIYLIDMLKNDEKCYLKEIAWLEEQGQHKKFRDSIQVGDEVTRNEDGVLVNLSQLKRVAKRDEKQGEQKPAWSEEDETGLGDALWAIQQARTIAKNENDMGNLWYAEVWLKSLKNRHTWKPSDLQIKALEYYTKSGCVDKEGIFGSELVKLLEELKKCYESKRTVRQGT